MKKILQTAFCALALYFSGTTDSSAQIKIISNGNVGIGTTSPTSLFHIEGGLTSSILYSSVSHNYDYGYNAIFKVTRNLTKALAVQNGGVENFAVMGDGSVWALGVWRWSDERFKKNIQPIEGAGSIIRQLNGKVYDMNQSLASDQGAPTQRNYGFIAQEIAKVLPEAVRRDSSGYYAVDYDAVIPVLVEAMKEQDNKISELQNKLESCCNATDQTGIAPKNKNTNGAFLYQNTPNPFTDRTEIKCLIPAGSKNAQVIVYTLSGEQLASYPVNGEGQQIIGINANSLQAGSYYYTLLVDGVEVDTKKMIILK